MVANILRADPHTPDPENGVSRSKFTFIRTWSFIYQIKENHECINMVPNILLADSPTLGMGPIGQNLPFSEYGHIEYQFKGNQKMQQQGSKYLPADDYPLAPTMGMVMLHIKIKRITNAPTW